MSQSQRRIIMPSDVFPPKCGGAGWSAHALALALQERGEHVTAVVPRAGQSALFHRYDVDDVPTINVAQPTITTPLLRDIVRQYMVIPRLQRAIRQAMIDPHQTIILRNTSSPPKQPFHFVSLVPKSSLPCATTGRGTIRRRGCRWWVINGVGVKCGKRWRHVGPHHNSGCCGEPMYGKCASVPNCSNTLIW